MLSRLRIYQLLLLILALWVTHEFSGCGGGGGPPMTYAPIPPYPAFTNPGYCPQTGLYMLPIPTQCCLNAGSSAGPATPNTNYYVGIIDQVDLNCMNSEPAFAQYTCAATGFVNAYDSGSHSMAEAIKLISPDSMDMARKYATSGVDDEDGVILPSPSPTVGGGGAVSVLVPTTTALTPGGGPNPSGANTNAGTNASAGDLTSQSRSANYLAATLGQNSKDSGKTTASSNTIGNTTGTSGNTSGWGKLKSFLGIGSGSQGSGGSNGGGGISQNRVGGSSDSSSFTKTTGSGGINEGVAASASGIGNFQFSGNSAGGFSTGGADGMSAAGAREVEGTQFERDKGSHDENYPTMLSADPEDYFSRIREVENIFEKVHKRYRNKSVQWAEDDLKRKPQE